MGNTLLAAAEPVINIPMMKRVVSEFVIKRRKVCMFRGTFGVGKTVAIRQACKEAGAHLVEIRLGQYDSVDLRGMPDIDKKNKTTVWYPPSTLPLKGTPGWPTDRIIVVFYDEITSASPPVFAVFYQAMQDFAIGEHEFMDNVVFCCAGNNDSDRGVVNRIPMPLNNRMLHFQIGLDVPAWARWAFGAGVSQRVIAYHLWKQKDPAGPALSRWNPDDPDPAPTQASPRSWEAAADIYRDYQSVDPDFAFIGMAGCVGEPLATDFLAFDKVYSKVLTEEQIVKNPRGVPLPDEESLIYATAVSVAGAMRLDNVKSLHMFLTRLNPEYTVMAWQLALAKKDAKGNPIGEALYTADEFLDLGDRYKAIFDPVASRKAA